MKIELFHIEKGSDCTEIVQTGINRVIVSDFKTRWMFFHKVFNRTVENCNAAVTFANRSKQMD
jgi:hypothetical protein